MAVDETSRSADCSTSYQVPGTLQETGFTIRAEEGSIVKGMYFGIYLRFFLFISFPVVLCAGIICCVECRHSIPMEAWWRHDMYILFYILYALPLYRVPGC